tara:strand:- start:717 stop:1463 length:747 start_codon:yes stop_codon:yes gene_type:complete
MEKIYEIDVTDALYVSMTGSERTTVLLLAHATNELNVLQRLIMQMDTGPISKHQAINDAETGMLFTIVRLLIGKIFETWNLLSTRVLQNEEISKKYLPLLNQVETNALQELKKEFGKRNLLSKLRNNFSFHFPSNAEIDNSLNSLERNSKLSFFVSETQGNCFYAGAELVILEGMKNQYLPHHFSEIAHDTITTSRNLGDVLGGLIGQILQSHIDIKAKHSELFPVADTSNINEAKISYFFDTSSKRP